MSTIYSGKIKQKARDLRYKGWSMGEISLKMKIPKNTISAWVNDIRLTDKQKERIKKKITESAAIGRPLAVAANRRKIEQWKEGIRNSVRHFQNMPIEDPKLGKLICGILYLCEGAKYPSTRGLIFGNSDPEIIKCFLDLLRRFFNIIEGRLRCRIMCRCDQNIKELKKHWSRLTKIPLKQFFKTTPDKRTRGKPTLKENYKGVCSVQYPSTALQFELQSIGELIMKNGAGGDRTLDPLPARQMLVPAELQPQNFYIESLGNFGPEGIARRTLKLIY